jgi:hypothetical protein
MCSQATPYFKNTLLAGNKLRKWVSVTKITLRVGVAQVRECKPSKSKTLISNSSTEPQSSKFCNTKIIVIKNR